MAIPVSVVLDRTPYGTGTLDLSPLVAHDTLVWSSVVPGGFASCSFTLDGDPRQLVKQVPYLSILRVVGDSGRVLFEGQIEDLSPSVTANSASLKVGAFGLQNVLDEAGMHAIFIKRDMDWVGMTAVAGANLAPGTTTINADLTSFATTTGNFDPTNLSKSGVQVAAVGGFSVPNLNGQVAEFLLPSGVTATAWLGSMASVGTDAGTTKLRQVFAALESGVWNHKAVFNIAGQTTFTFGLNNATALRVGAWQDSGIAVTLAAGDAVQFWDMRILGVVSAEDSAGGCFGDTLLKLILGSFPPLQPGTIEPGSDFVIDHLDSSDARRTGLDLVNEVAQYYTREWAVWEDALFDWTTPNLREHQWIVGIGDISDLDLDASTVNSVQKVFIQYTDAASGTSGEGAATSSDRRNPYVLNGRNKHQLVPVSFPMTSSTAAQFAARVIQNVGAGPVPASGTLKLQGEQIVQHAQGNAAKAWEIRAGDNITIPELPLADVFTQDGRGENLFHIISAEANTSDGTVTFSLDSFGSKRSDVLMARLAAVTHALGG